MIFDIFLDETSKYHQFIFKKKKWIALKDTSWSKSRKSERFKGRNVGPLIKSRQEYINYFIFSFEYFNNRKTRKNQKLPREHIRI